MPAPSLVLPSRPEGVKPLGPTRGCRVTGDKALAFYGSVLSRVKQDLDESASGLQEAAFGISLGEGPFPPRGMPLTPTVPRAPVSPSLSPSSPACSGEDFPTCQALVSV